MGGAPAGQWRKGPDLEAYLARQKKAAAKAAASEESAAAPASALAPVPEAEPAAEAGAVPAPGLTHSQSPVRGLSYTPVESKVQRRGPPLSEEEEAEMNNYLRYVRDDGWHLDEYGKEAFNGKTEEPTDLEKLTSFYQMQYSRGKAPKFTSEQMEQKVRKSGLSAKLRGKYGEDHHEAYLKWCDEVGGPWVALINSKDEKLQVRWKGIKAFLAEKEAAEAAEAGGDASGE